MSAYQDWNDDEDDFETGDPAGDSSVLRQLRKANAAKEKQIKELTERLASLDKQVRDRSISDVLSSRGLNPKIAVFIPADVEPTPEAVSTWVDQYGDVFGVQTQQAAPAEGQQQVQPDQPMSPQDMAALRQMDAVTSIGQAQEADILAQIKNAQSTEELARVLGGSF